MASSTEGRVCPRCGQRLERGNAPGVCTACALDEAWSAQNIANEGPLTLADLGEDGSGMFTVGGFALVRLLARGGMGVVYLARQDELGRQVALKLLVGGVHASPEVKRRFQQEAQTASRLHHPNIVPIYEVGEYHGQPYIAMEFVDGPDLARMAGGRPMAPHHAARYAHAVAEAMHYAHSRQVLHRDLKPSNILIGADDRPRVTDFGLARSLAADSSLTLSGTTLGTPSYLPPEQASARYGDLCPASDVYALGAILYELLTGRPPFLSGTVADTLRAVIEDDPVPPRVLNATVPLDLEVVTLKCLEKATARRYATAADLARDLDAYLRDEPISARPPSAGERLRKSFRRHRVAYLAGVVAASTCLVASGFVMRALVRERDARVIADAEALKSRHIAEFLQILLKSIEPSVALGRDTTLLQEVLRAASDRIDGELAAEPLVQADLHQSMGLAYQSLGQMQGAERQFRRALLLREQHLGLVHPAVAQSYYNLGWVLFQQSRLEEAEQWLRRSIEVRTRLYGSNDAELRVAQSGLAAIYLRQARYAEAERLSRELLEHTIRTFGKRSYRVVGALGNLGAILKRGSKHEEAIVLLRQALEVLMGLESEPGPERAGILSELGACLVGRGRPAEAEEALRQALELQERLLVPGDRSLAQTRAELGRALVMLGRKDEALPLLDAAIPVLEGVLGTNHVLVTGARAARVTAASPD